MNVHFRTSDQGDWVALYVEGKLVASNHSLDVRSVLDGLGIAYTSEVMELDDIGNTADGSDPFPERLAEPAAFVPKRYRVIAPDSHYTGRVMVSLDKAAIRRAVGNILGRDQEWYEHWDVILNEEPPNRDSYGIGFLSHEVEEVTDA